jgi:hypothetical protein
MGVVFSGVDRLASEPGLDGAIKNYSDSVKDLFGKPG